MSKDLLFDVPEVRGPESRQTSAKAPPRVVTATRDQVVLTQRCLDETLPEDHEARTIWAAVGELDLSAFYAPIQAREEHAGRPAVDPKILVALWLYATKEGVGSARELERLCRQHDAYRWLCGEVPMNHHTLSDFRVGHEQALDTLLTETIAVLMKRGLVKLERVALDGLRVRASAGTSSFKREPTLQECLIQAQQQLEAAKKQAQEPIDQRNQRVTAARVRAAEERVSNIRDALSQLPELRAMKARSRKHPKAKLKELEVSVRSSITDPEARKMKMADGGFRPAYNVQISTDVGSRAIVSADVTNVGSDMGLIPQALADVQRRAGQTPKALLVDGGFTKLQDIEAASKDNVTVYAPATNKQQESHAPKDTDSVAVAEWRTRMGTEEAKEIYKERASTAERTNADLRTHRGLDRFNVRGLNKVRCVVLWAALAYNLSLLA